MKSWQKLGICAAAIAIAAGGGSAAAGGGPPSAAPGNAAPAAAVDTAVESKYTPINPCRIVDTRKAGGKLSASTSRSFVAAGSTGFTGQGGNSTGCGIPDAATAIQVTITANSATGKGYLKAYPDNIGAPTATFMNYSTAFHVSVGGSITLDTAGSYDFKVSNYSYATHVIVDVLGYYVKPLTAYVNSDGALLRGHRAVSTSHGAQGVYDVKFDRTVTSCTYHATTYAYGIASVTSSWPADTVHVQLIDWNGTYLNSAFYLTVTC